MVMSLTEIENREGSPGSWESICRVGRRTWRKGSEFNLALVEYWMCVHHSCEGEQKAGK